MQPLIALFLRSIRGETRSAFTYAARLGMVLLLLAMLMMVQVISGSMGAPGLQFFRFLVGLNYFVITVAGLAYFSSAIAEEKDDATLGLLRMTSLDPLSILLGKSTSRLCGALMALAIQIPFALLAITMGGVMLRQVGEAYLSLGAYLFLLANIALVFSVVCARTATAAFATGAALVVFHLGPMTWRGIIWVLGRLGMFASPEPGPFIGGLLKCWNGAMPVGPLLSAAGAPAPAGTLGFQVTADVLLGAGLFVLAWVLFDRLAERGTEKAPARGPVPRQRSRGSFFGAGRAWPKAIVWKDFHFVAGGRIALAVKLLIVLGVAGFFGWKYFSTPPPPPPPPGAPAIISASNWTWFLMGAQRSQSPWFDFGSAVSAVLSPLLWIDLAISASRIFSIERKAQMLSSLATLPGEIWQLLLRKTGGCLLAAWPLLAGFIAASRIREFAMPDMAAPLNLSVIRSGNGLAADIALLLVIAALSLHLRWGSLPIGYVAWSIAGMLLSGFTLVFFQGLGPPAQAAAWLAAIVFLSRWIVHRLEVLIAES